MVAGKLHHTPRYRQKVRFVPLGISEPMWVDDPYFDVAYHLRHTAVPAPGSSAQLRTMAARVFSQHLDRARPLWEIWMVEGLEHGRWALLSKVHHCMVDGVAATDLMSVMFGDDARRRRRRTLAPATRAVDRRAVRPRRLAPRAPSGGAGERRDPGPVGAPARHGRVDARDRRGGADPAAVDVLVDRSDRPAPRVELGQHPARRRQRGPRRPRRHRQRRGPHDRHQRLP